MSGILNYAFDKLKSTLDEGCEGDNIGKSERVLSVVAGGFILGMGIKSLLKSPMTAVSGVALGGALIYRGVTGYCAIKDTFDSKKAEATVVEHRYFVK